MSVYSEISDLNTNLTAAKNAVTAKGGTVGDTGLAGLANEIDSIPSGSGGAIVVKDINFWDYDGTLLYSYTYNEAKELTSLPELPDHSDFLPVPTTSSAHRLAIAGDGWTHTLEQIKSSSYANVGACYKITDLTSGSDAFAKNYCAMIVETVNENEVLNLRFSDYTSGDIINWDYSASASGIQEAINSNSKSHTYTTPGKHLVVIFPDGSGDLKLGQAASSGTRYNFLGSGIGSSAASTTSAGWRSASPSLLVVGAVKVGPGSLIATPFDNIIITRQVKSIENGALYYVGSTNLRALILPPETPLDLSYSAISSRQAIFPIWASLLIAPLSSAPTWGTGTPSGYIACYGAFVEMPRVITDYAPMTTAGYNKVKIPSGWFDPSSSPTYINWGPVRNNTSTTPALYCPEEIVFENRTDFPTVICQPRTNAGGAGADVWYYGLPKLKVIDFRAQTVVPALASSTDFTERIQPNVKVVVPDNIYDSWIADANWSAVANQIIKASDYQAS